jgi:hypothetical protein
MVDIKDSRSTDKKLSSPGKGSSDSSRQWNGHSEYQLVAQSKAEVWSLGCPCDGLTPGARELNATLERRAEITNGPYGSTDAKVAWT